MKSCSAESFHKQDLPSVSAAAQETLKPTLEIIRLLSEQVKEYDRQIEHISKEPYPETELLRAIKGVGPLTALAVPLEINGLKVQVGASVGVAGYPQHGNNREELLNAADSAMYTAKVKGRNNCTLFHVSRN